MTAASRLAPEGGLRPATYATIVGLFVATGLRRSEAVHLRCSDVNLDGAFLTVRNTKFRKSRHVPIHATVLAKLRRYLAVRARSHAKISDTYWYLTGVPELMAVAGKRFEVFASTVGGGHHG